MAELRGIELPAEILEVYWSAVEEADDYIILDYAKYVANGLLKGLRPTKQNIPAIRKRLISHLKREKQISGNRLILLQYCRPLRFFEDFTCSMLETHLTGLCALHGKNNVIASLLLDEREEVQALAEEILGADREVDDLDGEDKNEFACRLLNFFGPFLDPAVDVLKASDSENEEAEGRAEGEAPAGDDAPRIKQQEEQITALKKQLGELKEERKKLRKDNQKLDAAQKKNSRLEKENKKLKEQQDKLTGRLEYKEQEYDALEAAIGEKVSEDLQSALHHWIRNPLDTEKEVNLLQDLPDNDLIGRAEAVIRHQEEVDRHAGNRRVLRDRLQHLTALKENMEELAIQSLNPVRELKAVREELQKEISRIKELLQIASGDDLTAQFRARIGAAASLEDLSDCKKLLEEMQRLEVLPRKAIQGLFVYCDARIMLLYDKHVPTVCGAAAPVSSLRVLREYIQNNTPVLWMLDGYNVLFQLPEYFNALDEEGKPTEASRRALSNKLQEITKDTPNVMVRLYFDGPEYAEYKPAPNMMVIYSGGEGDHRADDVICRDLEYLCLNDPEVPSVITTDDWDLRQRVEHLGANTVWVNEFYALVRAHDNGQPGESICRAVA